MGGGAGERRGRGEESGKEGSGETGNRRDSGECRAPRGRVGSSGRTESRGRWRTDVQTRPELGDEIFQHCRGDADEVPGCLVGDWGDRVASGAELHRVGEGVRRMDHGCLCGKLGGEGRVVVIAHGLAGPVGEPPVLRQHPPDLIVGVPQGSLLGLSDAAVHRA
jgi:hypothetical protein